MVRRIRKSQTKTQTKEFSKCTTENFTFYAYNPKSSILEEIDWFAWFALPTSLFLSSRGGDLRPCKARHPSTTPVARRSPSNAPCGRCNRHLVGTQMSSPKTARATTGRGDRQEIARRPTFGNEINFATKRRRTAQIRRISPQTRMETRISRHADVRKCTCGNVHTESDMRKDMLNGVKFS